MVIQFLVDLNLILDLSELFIEEGLKSNLDLFLLFN